jgi:hypothetical protein
MLSGGWEYGRVGELNLHTPKWTFSLWILDSRWTLEFSKSNYRGQNPSKWKVPHTIGKLLERRCLKWACMTHLNFETQVMVKRRDRNQIAKLDFRPLKVWNRPNFFACKWCATLCWKALDEGYNFAWNLILIRSLHTKLWPHKVAKVSILGISGLSFGTKCHLDVGLVERHKVYCKGEGDGSPKFRLWWVLSIWVCSWFVLTPKVFSQCTN